MREKVSTSTFYLPSLFVVKIIRTFKEEKGNLSFQKRPISFYDSLPLFLRK